MPEEAINMGDVIVTSSLIIGGLVVLIILFVVIYRQKMLQKEVELKSREALHQKDLLNATIEAQEKEQARIAKDLHDDLGALLSTLKLRVMHYEGEALSADSKAAHGLEMQRMLGQGIQSVRRIVSDLLPPILKDFGLRDGVEELVASFEKSAGINIELSISWDGARLPAEMDLPIYRITQELLNNSIKHADAETIWIHILKDADNLILEYRDNGRGIDMETNKKNLGFRNFESRTQALDGEYELSSSPGEGFKAFFEFPIHQAKQP